MSAQEVPLVSIAIPTFNRSSLVRRAIDSVLTQTYPNIQVIVVDDGSSDDTVDRLAPYVERHHVTVIRHSRNRGTMAAKNTGIDAMRGAFGGILDSDDELLPNAVERLMHVFDVYGGGVGLVFGNCVDPSTGTWTGLGLHESCEVTFADVVTGRVSGEFWGLWRQAVLGPRRFDPELPGGSESLVWHELYRHSRAFYVHEVVRRYSRGGADSVSRANLDPVRLARTRAMYERYLEQFGDDMRRLAPEAYVKQRQLIALWHLLAGERRAGIRQLWLARRAGGALRQHLLGAAMACLPAPVLRRAFLWRYERNLNRTR
ncbi:MAG: glycosyltransferase family 2 protein [Acidobacteria bacterium]|nr:glycosyltransferase family 2 protein [Acidobacteriota bacterium]